MNRLTDPNVAAVLKRNIEGLKRVGITPSIEHLRYIKLSDYEDWEERMNDAYEEAEEYYE